MANENIDKLFSLLDSLESSTSIAETEQELINLVRLVGAGAKGVRGKIRDDIISEFDQSPELKKRLVQYTKSNFNNTRSWTGSFIEQIFPYKEANDILYKMVENEDSAHSASWLCMNLARINSRSNSNHVCSLIGRTYDRFEGHESERLQIARAWGYAGCQKSLGILKKYLIEGGYDQTNTALDGLIGCSPIKDSSIIAGLWQVFNTTRFSEIRERTATVLRLADSKHHKSIIKKFITILSSNREELNIQKVAIDTLGEINFNDQIAGDIQDELINTLVYSKQEIKSQIISLLNRLYTDWVDKVINLIVHGDDLNIRKIFAHALSINKGSRGVAVKLLNGFLDTEDESIKIRVTELLKEIGGTEAFESLSSILNIRYIEPSEKLQEVSRRVFEETILRMRKNYNTTITMNIIVFAIGVTVIMSGIVLIIVDKANLLFGTAGVIAGLGTLVSLFFLGSIKRVQKSLTEIVQVEVAYLSFMHRILQARSIFERQYVSEEITLESLEKFDNLLHGNMQSTMELLEKYCELDQTTTTNKK